MASEFEDSNLTEAGFEDDFKSSDDDGINFVDVKDDDDDEEQLGTSDVQDDIGPSPNRYSDHLFHSKNPCSFEIPNIINPRK
jgi:hypothetical protein